VSAQNAEGRSLHAVPEVATEKLTIAQAVRDAMLEEMDRDDRVIVLGEDVGVDGGVFRATDGLIERFGSERVIDTPLAESSIIGMSVGLAATGFRPIAEIQFMGFVYPAINQLFGHAARMRNRTRGRLSCPMVVRMPYGGGIHPPEHHSESYEALFLNTPGFKVVVPSNPYDAKGLLISAIRDEDPVLFMEPKRIYRAFREAVPADSYSVPLGKAEVVREGTDVSLIAWGAMVRVCLDASEVLAREDISAEVVDLRTLNPLDRETMIASVVGAEISAQIHEHAMLQLHAPVQRVTGFDVIFPLAQSEKLYLPSRERIVKAVEKVLAF
jgi:pyruvate dehydrogenase E1 component beta subunit